MRPENRADWLLTARRLTPSLPSVELSAEQAIEIAAGRYIELSAQHLRGAQDIAALGPNGELHSILQPRGADQYGARVNLGDVPGS
jgi:hypothetical protein